MNRKWMCHMKATYPEINENMMSLLRASHEALAFQREDDILQTVPLHMSVDNDPLYRHNET
jgi:hypothetical protein